MPLDADCHRDLYIATTEGALSFSADSVRQAWYDGGSGRYIVERTIPLASDSDRQYFIYIRLQQ